MSAAEASKWLDCTSRYVRMMCGLGILEAKREGALGAIFVSSRSIEHYLRYRYGGWLEDRWQKVKKGDRKSYDILVRQKVPRTIEDIVRLPPKKGLREPPMGRVAVVPYSGPSHAFKYPMYGSVFADPECRCVWHGKRTMFRCSFPREKGSMFCKRHVPRWPTNTVNKSLAKKDPEAVIYSMGEGESCKMMLAMWRSVIDDADASAEIALLRTETQKMISNPQFDEVPALREQKLRLIAKLAQIVQKQQEIQFTKGRTLTRGQFLGTLTLILEELDQALAETLQDANLRDRVSLAAHARIARALRTSGANIMASKEG